MSIAKRKTNAIPEILGGWGGLLRFGLLIFGVSGLALAAGAWLHPFVPEDGPSQMDLYAGHKAWEPSHWVLTFAQLSAAMGLAFVVPHVAPRANGLLRGSLAVMALGLVLGTLGTLSAATGLVEAARAGDATLFRTLSAWTMAIGWVCVATTSVGASLAGFCVVRARERGLRGGVGWTAFLGGATAFASTLALGPAHPWTHSYLLRFGAMGFGLLAAAAAGAWALALRSDVIESPLS